MAKKKYEDLANRVVDLVGGKDNISYFTHCITRLRFNIKDKSYVNVEEIEKIDGVVGTNWSGAQLQIIIGQSVDEAYKLICEKNGLEQKETINENLDFNNDKKEKKTIGSLIGSFFENIAGCVTPLIPVLIGCGMIKVIIILIELAGVSSDNSTYQILSWVGDAGFYFLPILAGRSAAKKFGANEGFGMVVGAMLIYPTFISGVSEGTSFNFLGIPIYGASYTSTIFPVIMCVFVMAQIERFIVKYSPEALRSIIEPTLTLLIMIPITYCILGPLGAFLGQYLASFIIWLYDTIGFLSVGILSALFPLIVMTGMHTALSPYCINMIATAGYDPIVKVASFFSNIYQGIACLAVAAKTKDTNLRSTSISCAITAVIGGITEPAIYGVNLKYRTPLYGAMIGNFTAGCIAGLFSVYCYALGASSLLGLPQFIGENSMNIVYAIIALVIGCIVTFIVTFILYKEDMHDELSA